MTNNDHGPRISQPDEPTIKMTIRPSEARRAEDLCLTMAEALTRQGALAAETWPYYELAAKFHHAVTHSERRRRPRA